jgi:hypothetical protein
MFIVIGGISVLVAAAGYLSPRVRNIEDELPDAVPVQEEGESELESTSGDALESEPTLSQAD